MSDHANTIRRIIRHAKLSNDAETALDALLQLIEMEAKWKRNSITVGEINAKYAALAKLTPSAVRVYAEVEQLKAERDEWKATAEDSKWVDRAAFESLREQRQQAIEALREIVGDYEDDNHTCGHMTQTARAALAKLGEQPK